MANAYSADKERQDIEKLVRSLVSQNKEPPPPQPHTPYVYPPHFGQEENRRVIAARDALLAKGVEAFPYLIDGLDDSRYSYTAVFPKWAMHLHVREVCLNIIKKQVEVYRAYTRPIGFPIDRPRWLPVPPNRLFPVFFWPNGAKEFMQKWWTPRKSMTLCDLQREAVEWAVQYERGRGFIDKGEESLVLDWYKPLQCRLKSSEKGIQVGYDGRFLDEDNLKPKDSDLEQWHQRWGERWGTKGDNDAQRRHVHH